MKTFFQIYQHFSPELKRRFWLLFFGMVFLAVVETVTVGIIAFYAAAISDPQATYDAFMGYHFILLDPSQLFPGFSIKLMIALFSLLLIIAVVIKNILSGVVTYHIAKFSAATESHFGSRLLDSFLNRDYQWHLNKNSADLVQKVNWRHFLGRYFITSCLKMTAEIAMLMVLLAGLLLVQPLVSLLFIATQGVAGIVVYRFLRKGLDHSARGCQEAETILNRTATCALHAIKDVQISGARKYFVDGFQEWGTRFSTLFGKQQFWQESPLLALESLGFVMIAGAILFMLFGLEYSPLETTGTTALLAVTAWRTLPAFNRVVSSMAGMRTAMPYVSSLLEEMSEMSDLRSSGEGTVGEKTISFVSAIKFVNVSFSYDGHRSVLQALNFEIPCGKSLGIVGPSGSGKSTLIDLLTGLLWPQGGEIRIDDKLLSEENVHSWRKSIGYVPQFPYILDGTLAENIAFGQAAQDIDRERVVEVCRMAAIDFLDQLSDGIDSIIGERGIKLSGGQRQRVAIARALYRCPKLIIFDEATSALDEDKDFEIRQLILQLKGKQTLVIVSHRPSTIAECDNIVKIDRLL
ncbi:ABC transporter ATP-binding protein [Geothermobacter hydrogeniphilus]|uniref:ABC transporter ATP-binding protein n=1 Tax=Geothermobacter hydrogeniphilus TaxID=1969733 RepID=A0A1X0Y1N9_9BACT|nr:ABC transporter ATP-binding protein [Geothermobacter hydrogeniphilus]ORJ59121.1 hypothetical protein B5V00_11170 [Geothermobacter hydrogeniphilus]